MTEHTIEIAREFFKDLPDADKKLKQYEAGELKLDFKKEAVMTFGKYKGKKVRDIIIFDEKYASYLYRQEYVKKFTDIYRELNTFFTHGSK